MDTLTLTLTPQAFTLILRGLGKLPFEEVNVILNELVAAANAQAATASPQSALGPVEEASDRE
jgi:hypothetical protein